MSQRELVVVQVPPFHRYPCLPLSSFTWRLFSVSFQSVRLSSEPAHLHPRRRNNPSDHLAGTQLYNCASRQMPCTTVGDGGGGVTQSPSILLLSPPLFTQLPQGPHPQHPSLHTFSSPVFLPPCHSGLVHLGPGNSGEAVCVGSSQQLPSITAHCSVAQ